jgi:hypothetical protein
MNRSLESELRQRQAELVERSSESVRIIADHAVRSLLTTHSSSCVLLCC